MQNQTLLGFLEFSRARLLGSLDAIEKSGQDLTRILAWRPGPGRAHIGWQAMHCAATHDRYLNVGILQSVPVDAELVKNFAGGSTPSDTDVPSLLLIRQKLAQTYEPLKRFVLEQSPDSLARQFPAPGGKTRSVAEAITLLAWHEAHHQGQIHLTWNLFKAANGIS